MYRRMDLVMGVSIAGGRSGGCVGEGANNKNVVCHLRTHVYP